jgi:CRP-like cAMP-binding protein
MVESQDLQRYSLFGGLLAEQIDQIRPLMEQETYQSGDDIILEGSPNDKIRFILDGKAEVLKGKTSLFEFGEGDAFGEMEVLDVMPSAATIRALSDTRVISISNRALREIYKVDIKTFALLIMNLARDLSRRLRNMDEKATHFEGGAAP